MEKVLITGVYRSGTTLLEKVLQGHSELYIASQPLPSLYFYIKQRLNLKLGLNKIYPINPDFSEAHASLEELNHFLESHIVSLSEWKTIVQQLKKYKGQQTPEIFDVADKIHSGSFENIFNQVHELLAEINKKEGIAFSGSKELFAEEFTPYILSKGHKVVFIIRDPRDIICSLNFGKGMEYTGAIRPLLYSLRLWRKSVAYKIRNSSNENFLSIKFEDLVKETEKTLDVVAHFLGVKKFRVDDLKNDIELWKGNSSHTSLSGITDLSIERYKSLLTRQDIKYIETICFPEMKYMGYPFDEIENMQIDIIRSYKEPFEVSNKLFNKEYTHSSGNIQKEEGRVKLLNENISQSLKEDYFLFPEVYDELKKNIL